jgi:hypothetical protein
VTEEEAEEYGEDEDGAHKVRASLSLFTLL